VLYRERIKKRQERVRSETQMVSSHNSSEDGHPNGQWLSPILLLCFLESTVPLMGELALDIIAFLSDSNVLMNNLGSH
jgi:hypothetical protein